MPTKIIAELKNKELQNVLNTAEKEHSDLVTGKYEGMKVFFFAFIAC